MRSRNRAGKSASDGTRAHKPGPRSSQSKWMKKRNFTLWIWASWWHCGIDHMKYEHHNLTKSYAHKINWIYMKQLVTRHSN